MSTRDVALFFDYYKRKAADALLAAPEPPRREIEDYALAARTTLERELVRALHAERDFLPRQQRAENELRERMIAVERARTVEAMQAFAIAEFDRVLSDHRGSSAMREDFVRRMGIDAEQTVRLDRFLGVVERAHRRAAKQFRFTAGDIGRFGNSPGPWPPTHGRPVYAIGDEVLTDDGQRGTITGPPNEQHPHTARVALEDGGLYDISLSRLRGTR